MVVPGIIRKVNKNLPNLLQVILFICVVHYFGQGVLVKIQRKFQLGRYARFNPSIVGTGDNKKKNGHFNKMKNQAIIRPPSTSTTTTTPPPPPPPYYETEKVMEERIKILHDGCTKWNLGTFAQKEFKRSEDDEKDVQLLPKTPLYQALFVSEKKQISYCPMARCGLNWISKRLLELSGQYTPVEISHLKQPPSVVARQQYPYLSSWERYSQVLPHYTNFLIVRHPFDRLLASYRSILENAEKDSHNYLKYGRRIVRTVRKEPGGGKEPTFSEFITFVIERDVKYLDDAWQPFSRRCTPCLIPYTVVLHFETLWNDTLWTWQKANLPELNTTDYVTNSITPEIKRKYFSEITVHQLAKLHHKYRIDFDLFGYKLDEHLLYVQPGTEPLTSDILNLLPLSRPKKSDDEIDARNILNDESLNLINSFEETKNIQSPFSNKVSEMVDSQDHVEANDSPVISN